MADRQPIVLVSGAFAELPPGDGIIGASVTLISNPSGLYTLGGELGYDGTAITALASGNAALTDVAGAVASGNAALVDSAEALASGNAALTLAVAEGGALASGNAALADAATALASGNAGIALDALLQVTLLKLLEMLLSPMWAANTIKLVVRFRALSAYKLSRTLMFVTKGLKAAPSLWILGHQITLK